MRTAVGHGCAVPEDAGGVPDGSRCVGEADHRLPDIHDSPHPGGGARVHLRPRRGRGVTGPRIRWSRSRATHRLPSTTPPASAEPVSRRANLQGTVHVLRQSRSSPLTRDLSRNCSWGTVEECASAPRRRATPHVGFAITARWTRPRRWRTRWRATPWSWSRRQRQCGRRPRRCRCSRCSWSM